MEDVDLEPLHGPGRHRGQRRVDLLELLERDALGVGQRRSRRLGGGRSGRPGRRGGRTRGTRVAAFSEREDGEHDRQNGDQDRQADPNHQPLAPGAIAPPVCGRDLDEDRGSLVEPLGGLVVDGCGRVLLGIWGEGRHRRFLVLDGTAR